MKIVHISPTYFSNESILGGGERFTCELAKAMAKYCKVELISFGQNNKMVSLSDNLKLYIFKRWNKNMLNPFNPLFLKRLKEANIIHCHQYLLHFTKLAIIFAKIFKKKIFVTDLGLASPKPCWYFDWSKWINKFLLMSCFSARYLEKHFAPKEVVYAGVDTHRYRPALEKQNKVVFVGRLHSFKGVNYLIEAMPSDIELDIIGPVYDKRYYQLLQKLSLGKRVNFIHYLNDQENLEGIAEKLSTATLLVLPSVPKCVYGDEALNCEIFGLVLLEAMASGCAVIGTNMGGIPEIILDGLTGFLVPPNDPVALREKIVYLINHPEIAREMGKAGRRRVEEMFTWDLVAKRCLRAYGV